MRVENRVIRWFRRCANVRAYVRINLRGTVNFIFGFAGLSS